MNKYFLLLVPLVQVQTLPEQDGGDVGLCEQDPHCQRSLPDAVSDFTESLYADIAKRTSDDNFVFSPLSIHSALTLLYSGSTDNSTTRGELRKALGSITSPALIREQYRDLVQSYQDQQSFLYSNSIWAQNGLKIDKNFTDGLKEHFGAETNNIDFTKESSVEEVNSWISNQTRGLVPKLVQGFSPSTLLFLANALYFKDKWLVPFQETNETGYSLESEPFYGESTLRVPMMLTSNVDIGVGNLSLGSNNATFLTIPYINKQFEMQIILPNGDRSEGKGLAILEDYIKKNSKRDKHNDHNIFQSPKQTFDDVEDVRLVMPKFSVSTKFDASKYLKSLGVNQIFKEAELEKLVSGSQVAVSNILHKAVVKVDKDGTEGAAATGVGLVLLSGSFGRNLDVYVNRPFIFIVQDKKNNIPVLVGRVKNPLV